MSQSSHRNPDHTDEALPAPFREALRAQLSGERTPLAEVQLEGWYQQVREQLEREEQGQEGRFGKNRRTSGVGSGSRLAQKNSPSNKQAPRWHASAIAVGAIVVLGLLGVITVKRASLGFRTMRHASTRTYATTVGRQAMVTLSNGAQVRLGPATTLSVVTNPASPSIDVQLVGEALFVVTHNQHQAFQVRTSNAVTRVLGTTFMVRRYPAESLTRVVVAEGRVSLAGVTGSAAGKMHPSLSAHTLGIVDDSGHATVTPNIAVQDYTSWTTGQLVFRDTPAKDVVSELGRAYGVDIRIADSTLAMHPLSWTVMVADWSLLDVLEPLAATLNAHLVRAGHVITLVPGRPASRRPVDGRFPHPSEPSYGK